MLSSEPKIHDNSKMTAFHSVMKILLQFTKLESAFSLWQQVKCIVYRDTIFSEYEYLTDSIIQDKSEHPYEKIKLDVTEIKTHSMNILRTLFRHSQLGDMVKDYIADGLITAFKNYDSNTWAVSRYVTSGKIYRYTFYFTCILFSLFVQRIIFNRKCRNVTQPRCCSARL